MFKLIWNKYKIYIILIGLTILGISGYGIYNAVTAKKPIDIIKPELEKLENIEKKIDSLNLRIDETNKIILQRDKVIKSKEKNYDKPKIQYQKDSIAISRSNSTELDSFISREISKRK